MANNIETTAAESIEGWWLNNPSEELFVLEDTGREEGFCLSETCSHWSHDEMGPVYKLTLRNGMMAHVGTDWKFASDERDPMDKVDYYAIPEKGCYLKVTTPFHFNKYAEIVTSLPTFQPDDEYGHVPSPEQEPKREEVEEQEMRTPRKRRAIRQTRDERRAPRPNNPRRDD